ncbi:MAG: CpXC domain-containing protein [Solobacterium sp.]|nr:CpXC domain-containing protein [Solobacterium sp.]
MSSSRTVSYTCPYCGKNYEIEIYDSVTADEDTDLRDRCLSGDLFRSTCPRCKHDFLVQYPLVYIDRDHRFVIWLNENAPSEDLMRSIASPLVPQGYTLRRTPTLKEFAEKIQILEDGVDDRVVEVAKYDSLIEYLDNKKGNAEDITAIEYQRTENEVMKINIRTDDKGLSFLIPVSMVEEEMKESGSLYDVDNTTFPVINADWIISLFAPAGSEKLS